MDAPEQRLLRANDATVVVDILVGELQRCDEIQAVDSPTCSDLADWLPQCDPAVREAAGERMRTIPGLGNMWPAPEDLTPENIGIWIMGIHQAWAKAWKNNVGAPSLRPKHPILPVLRNWLETRPRLARRARQDVVQVLPPCAGRTAAALKLTTDSNSLPAAIVGFVSPPNHDTRVWLPGLEPRADERVSAFILAVLDGMKGPHRTRSVRLRDRYFAELLMDLNRADRAAGGVMRIRPEEVLRVKDVVGWSSWTTRSYRPNNPDRGMVLARELDAVSEIKMPINARGGWIRPVVINGVEGRNLDDRIRATFFSLPDKMNGTAIDREVLRQAGKVSQVAWRLCLAFAFAWDRISRKGKVIGVTQDEYRRDAAGYLLDAKGEILMDKRGRPMRRGNHSRKVKTGRMVPNPVGEAKHGEYDPECLVRLAWPIGHDGREIRHQRQCINAVRWLSGERHPDGRPIQLMKESVMRPFLKIERLSRPTRGNPDGFPWRILPPGIKTMADQR